ncbi:polysaccharide deacetylase family protein [Geobacillus thermodenitrificans]|jgi:peptidoglycan-N-acetylglucosamine deacetylase|uniref:Polysaccharide deacetylase, putative n=2 Tax=Geobacillus thermodenitrificans TaxID=33940 RepID=A4ITT8_GEOTN|nr:polysaccharide deacetylase family protein [Geobacillus thermodenitrificans]ABO68742.1 Polysaccharide deacetylase, putative [Geobacillus thermodenitrificans NG80-2]ARA98187.1 polysaccharide deacetylase [Geobacillus thermodenitrificans]ARP44480.1 Peptidoglycan-N-acetylmuramic acid deacetylase PdaC [Geobacillus thermodenitrificans]ATO37546.1 polysaccharide deacetylase [Geobacillus thermodenitrificans]MEC5188224.1 chitin deacetylase [Geobacillus thermodenitrificans]
MKKKLKMIGISILIVILALFGMWKLINSRTFQLFGGITDKVETSQKVIALTFDDGPTKNVDDILALLDRYNAKATFFLIGSDLEKNLDEAKKIVAAGHQIGNHTYSHQRMVFRSPSFIKNEIEKTDKLIRKAGYSGEIDFRPPYGKKLVGVPYYLYTHNRDTITWDIEPDTYYTSSKDKINYVIKNVKPGSIILMHPMYDQSGEELRAIEGILQSLSKEGYKFITVNELQGLEK